MLHCNVIFWWWLFSPLFVLVVQSEVIRTRDASSLPLPFLTMVTIQCLFWTLYGHLQVNSLLDIYHGSRALAPRN